MATATSNSMGITNIATGSFTGAGAQVEVDVGFKPRYIKIVDETNVITWEKVEGMAAANSVKTVTAGTTTVDTGSAILIDSDENGFTVSATLAANAATIVWMAID